MKNNESLSTAEICAAQSINSYRKSLSRESYEVF